MDFLRSCYTTTAHFKAGDPRVSTLNWYFCKEGAEQFTVHHAFGSLNWSRGSPASNTVGEIIGAPRPYSRGANPGLQGTNFCGNESDYLGIEAFLTTPRPSGQGNLPLCCEGVLPINCQIWVPNHNNQLDSAVMLTPGYTLVNINHTVNSNYYRIHGPIGFDLIDYATAGRCQGVLFAGNVVADSNGDQYQCEFISGAADGSTAIWQTPNVPGEIPVTQIQINHSLV